MSCFLNPRDAEEVEQEKCRWWTTVCHLTMSVVKQVQEERLSIAHVVLVLCNFSSKQTRRLYNKKGTVNLLHGKTNKKKKIYIYKRDHDRGHVFRCVSAKSWQKERTKHKWNKLNRDLGFVSYRMLKQTNTMFQSERNILLQGRSQRAERGSEQMDMLKTKDVVNTFIYTASIYNIFKKVYSFIIHSHILRIFQPSFIKTLYLVCKAFSTIEQYFHHFFLIFIKANISLESVLFAELSWNSFQRAPICCDREAAQINKYTVDKNGRPDALDTQNNLSDYLFSQQKQCINFYLYFILNASNIHFNTADVVLFCTKSQMSLTFSPFQWCSHLQPLFTCYKYDAPQFSELHPVLRLHLS